MHIILNTLLILGLLGICGAVLLYVTAKKFHTEEDPRIDTIASLLPGANCGGCGFKGCRDFATQCVSKNTLDGLYCPVSGAEVMVRIADILGVESKANERKIAVLKCNGTCSARRERYVYDGAESCAIMDAVSVGSRGCSYGCLGCGDCTTACRFGAIHMNTASGLPEIDPDMCTSCGACVGECPRHLIELRPAGEDNRRVWVACANRERGAIARRICSAACIGCGKCLKSCTYGAITISDNLSYINPVECSTCGSCVELCPTGAIQTSFEIKTE